MIDGARLAGFDAEHTVNAAPEAGFSILVYRIGIGYGLRVVLVGGLPHPKTLVEIIGYLYRADPLALTARGAFGYVDVPRLYPDIDGEVPRSPIYGCDLGKCMDGDVGVPCAVNELGGEDAHGAVVRGEGLVEHRHGPTYGWGALHQVDGKTHVC